MAENGDSVKTFASVAMLLAMLGGMAALLRPMHLNIGRNADDLASMREDLKRHGDKEGHPDWQTQEIKDLKAEILIMQTDAAVDNIRERDDYRELGAIWTRIRNLEQFTYGRPQDGPVEIGP